MKKTSQTSRRVAALSLATIISLNMITIAFAESDIVIPKEDSVTIEMEGVKEDEVNQELESELKEEVQKTEVIEIQEVQTLQEESIKLQNEEIINNNYIESEINKAILESFEIDGSKSVNSPHMLKAKASSQNGVLYKFYVKDLSINKWTVIQDYSDKTTATWIPKKDGEYWYGVHIKDKKSTEAKDTHLYRPITIDKLEKATLESLELEGSGQAHSAHTIRAAATSQNGVLYKFYVKDLSINKWIVIQDYSEKTTATWTPSKKGDYWYGVHIKDKYSNEPIKDNHLYKSVTIKPLEPARVESLEIEGSLENKSPQVLKALASSPNKALYKFYIKDLSTNKWTVIQDYSEKDTVTWIPEKPGNYWYGVHVKDIESKEPVKDNHLYKNVTIKPLEPARVESLEIEGSLENRSPQVLKALASSPNKALYKFYIKDLSTNKWTVIQDYSEKDTVIWIPEKPGNYWYGVHVKDIESKEPVKDNHLYKNVEINQLSPAKLEDFTISGGGYEKTNHILQAKASSTNGVLYKFYVKDLSTNKWSIIQDYSEKDTAIWRPEKVGKYWYGVHIKDKMSDNDRDNHLYRPFTVNPPVYYNVINYGDTLQQALDKQMNVSGTKPQTTSNGKWVNATRDQVASYLNPNRFLQFEPESSAPKYTQGTVTTDSLNMRSGPSVAYAIVGKTTKGQVHKIVSESNGWFLIESNGVRGWVSGSYMSFPEASKGEEKYIISLQITASSGLNVRQSPNTTSAILTQVTNGNVYIVLDTRGDWYKINAGGKIGWVSGDYIKLINDVPREMYQFMVLSGQCGVSTSVMNTELIGKGILDGKGAAFIEGSKKYNVNELYLMAHAFLETGNGTSSLANGILVSSISQAKKDKDGNILKDKDGKTIMERVQVEPKVTYNMYGIGAVDSNALNGGAERAYKEGWFTPEKAITEGAHWISNKYINNTTYKQDTLYKMKWNPVKPGTHQYATDIGWALKQTRQIDLMMEICRKMESTILRFDIPKYR